MRQEWTESKIVLILSDCTTGRADRKASQPCCDIYPHSLISPQTDKHIVQPTTDAHQIISHNLERSTPSASRLWMEAFEFDTSMWQCDGCVH